MSVRIEPLSPAIGAEVTGVDPRRLKILREEILALDGKTYTLDSEMKEGDLVLLMGQYMGG